MFVYKFEIQNRRSNKTNNVEPHYFPELGKLNSLLKTRKLLVIMAGLVVPIYSE